jgi:hypothetical protein
VAQQKSKRRSRKPRGGTAKAPRAVPSARREQRAARVQQLERSTLATNRVLGTVGERPRGLFGDLPVSEILILLGIIGIVAGVINGGGPALLVGVGVCALAVLEITVREHFSGFRSHTSLLAAVPALIVETVLVEVVGVPSVPILLFLPIIPVFALGFWQLRRMFQVARQTRLARPPGA